MLENHTLNTNAPTLPKRDSLMPSVPITGTGFRRFLAFAGPGYLVATGYMDPGNWATAIAAGAKFGPALLFIAVLSSLMAIVLQALSARLAFATGHDLASLSRREYPRPVTFVLWIAAELAIIATDIAEVIGTAIGLELLTGIPLWIGVLITGLDALLILLLERFGFRKIEAFVIALLVVIAASFAVELALARPDWHAVAAGLVPTISVATNPEMLYLAVGILGATVMPHNLFLHSGIVRTRAIGPTDADKKEAITFSVIDSTVALMFALVINASILILAAAVFHKAGRHDVAELGDAYRLIEPLLGSALAAKLFGVALICCGLNSTITATLAGQIVMDGFLNIRLPAFWRRLITRSLAIVPAMFVTLSMGEAATGKLLVFSQVVLGVALPFAVLPLIHLSSNARVMERFLAPLATRIAGWAIAAIIVALNVKLLGDLLMPS